MFVGTKDSCSDRSEFVVKEIVLLQQTWLGFDVMLRELLSMRKES